MLADMMQSSNDQSLSTSDRTRKNKTTCQTLRSLKGRPTVLIMIIPLRPEIYVNGCGSMLKLKCRQH